MKPYEKFFEGNWRDYEGEGEEEFDSVEVGDKFISPDNPQYEYIEIGKKYNKYVVAYDCIFHSKDERDAVDTKPETTIKMLIHQGHWVKI